MPCAPARSLALRAYGLARRQGSWVRDALRESAGKGTWGAQDRALAWRLAMGATLARGLLEERVLSFVAKPANLEPQVRDALTLGAFELGFLATPVAVAVDEWVEAVKGSAPKAAGLANAVLRKVAPLRRDVARARERVSGGRFSLEDLAVGSGLPPWLLAAVLAERGEGEAVEWALGALDAAPLWLVATSRSARGEELQEAGLCPKPEALPGIWRIDGPQAVVSSDVLGRGFAPEDRSAYQIALASTPAPGGSRLEVGVGRGTKALVAATALASRGASARMVGVDLSKRRLSEARERLEASGYEATLIRGDGRRLGELVGDERFDLVLVDAPCSGTGTLRRHPEIAWSLGARSLDLANPTSLPVLQLELLRSASRALGEGGTLLYATCSVLGVENRGVVEAFLYSEDGRAFELADLGDVPIFSQLDETARSRLSEDGFDGPIFQTRLLRHGADGHFLAALRRRRT